MAIVVGSNSWVTVAEADTYLEGKWGASGWAGLDPVTQKTPLLISAFRWIRRLTGYSVPADSTDQNVKDAQCEAAWYLYKHGTGSDKREALRAQGVKAFRVMSFSETLTASEVPDFIADLLKDYESTYGHAKITVSRDMKSNAGDT